MRPSIGRLLKRARRALLPVPSIMLGASLTLVLSVLIPPGPASAAVITVHCPTDDLQTAIDDAANGDTLAVSGTCGGVFTISKDLTLRGDPRGTLDGQRLGPTLRVQSGSVTLIRLVIRGGENQVDSGGGIQNNGDLTVIGSTLTHNDANPGDGGGIFNGREHQVTLIDSTLDGNTAHVGGNIFNQGTFTIVRSTVTEGSTEGVGGAISNAGTVTITDSTISRNSTGGAIYTLGIAVTIVDSTITGNRGGLSGGITNLGGQVYVQGTILAGNLNGFNPDCAGAVTSQGYNLVGDVSGCTYAAADTDLVGTSDDPIDPMLGPLALNGGHTRTHALLPGSPAIDAGGAGPCRTATDQRGLPRPQGSACDIGAFETRRSVRSAWRQMLKVQARPGTEFLDASGWGQPWRMYRVSP